MKVTEMQEGPVSAWPETGRLCITGTI